MSLIGLTVEEQIWNFFKEKGFNDYGIAGLMGNLYAESALNPMNLENYYETRLGYTDASYTRAVDNGSYTNFVNDSAGYGLAQWTYYTRKRDLLNYVKSKSKSIGDLETQLEFLYKELEQDFQRSVFSVLLNAESVLEASNAVLINFERPTDQSVSVQERRSVFGQLYYDKYHSTEIVITEAEDILNIARGEIGVTEYPPRSNNVKYNTRYWGKEVYGDEDWPWCMAFVWWVFDEAKLNSLFFDGGKTASCPTFYRWASKTGRWYTSNYKPGDIVIFRFSSSGYDHVGIVEQVLGGGTYITIEGNTSLTDDDNGGAVMRRTRYSSQIVGGYRPAYKVKVVETPQEDEEMTQEKFNEMFMTAMKAYRATLRDNDSGAWSNDDKAWVIQNGIFQGSGPDADGNPNYMWEDFLTREQAAALMHRLSKVLNND